MPSTQRLEESPDIQSINSKLLRNHVPDSGCLDSKESL